MKSNHTLRPETIARPGRFDALTTASGESPGFPSPVTAREDAPQTMVPIPAEEAVLSRLRLNNKPPGTARLQNLRAGAWRLDDQIRAKPYRLRRALALGDSCINDAISGDGLDFHSAQPLGWMFQQLVVRKWNAL